MSKTHPCLEFLKIMICWSGFERKQGSYDFQPLLVNQITVEMGEMHLL